MHVPPYLIIAVVCLWDLFMLIMAPRNRMNRVEVRVEFRNPLNGDKDFKFVELHCRAEDKPPHGAANNDSLCLSMARLFTIRS